LRWASFSAVAEHLDLDVAGAAEVFLDIDLVVAEGSLGFRPRGAEGGVDVGVAARDLHAAPAPARGRLDDDGIADVGGDAARGSRVGNAAVGPRDDRDAKRLGRVLGGDLVAHQADVFGGRTDERQAVVLDDLHEGRVFRQEAVAGMNRLGAGDLAGRDDRGEVQVALPRRRRADAHGLVGHADVHRVGVGGRMDGDGPDAHLAAGADHPQRDLAAVGDEDLVEHPPVTRRSSGARRIRRGRRHPRRCA